MMCFLHGTKRLKGSPQTALIFCECYANFDMLRNTSLPVLVVTDKYVICIRVLMKF